MRKTHRLIAEETREILASTFPNAFSHRGEVKKPLKVGIYKDIRQALPHLRALQVGLALADYTRGAGYMVLMVEGAARVDLSGAPCGAVTKEHAEQAATDFARCSKATREKWTAIRDKGAAPTA